jgi:hypothetical protein
VFLLSGCCLFIVPVSTHTDHSVPSDFYSIHLSTRAFAVNCCRTIKVTTKLCALAIVMEASERLSDLKTTPYRMLILELTEAKKNIYIYCPIALIIEGSDS